MKKVKDSKGKKLIYLFISLFFLYHFIKGKFFFESKKFEMLYSIFGVYYYFLIAYPLLISYSFSLEDSKRKMVLKTRLFSAVLFFFFCTLLIVMFQLREYSFEGIRLEKQLIKTSWVEDELGGLATMLIDLLYFNMEKLHLYLLSAFAIFISSFFIFGSTVKGVIKSIINIIRFYKDKKELIRREKELEEKISIKESIEKDMLIKKEKYLQEKERKIREKVIEILEESPQLKDSKIELKNPRSDVETISGDSLKESKIIKEENDAISNVTLIQLADLPESQKKEAQYEKNRSDILKWKDEINDTSI